MSDQPAVIVTGASKGLGAGISRMLAQLGARVVLTARSASELDAVASAIKREGGQAVTVPGDISDPDTSQRAVRAALDHFGQLDAIVNNAGVLEPIAPLADANADAWQQALAVNVLGPVLLARAALPHLRARHGRVINISSGAARNPISGWGAYCASKAALNQLTGVLALEEPAVTAIAVRPGVVDTDMQATIRQHGEQGMVEQDLARFQRYYEQGALLPPEQPGRAIAALALYAPRDWSGEFLSWDEDRVMGLAGLGD